MKRKKYIVITILVILGVIAIVVFSVSMNKRNNLKKKFAELGERFTSLQEGNYEEYQKLLLPEAVYDIVKETANFKMDVEDHYLMYDACNRRCEIRNYKVLDYERIDSSITEDVLEKQVGYQVDIEIEEEYIVNAIMEVRYRCDYEDGQLPGEMLYKCEPYIYNGFWSDWQTERHSYGMYKVDGEWHVFTCDDEE